MKAAFLIFLNVLNAILIRDIKVRSGAYFTGYFFVFLLPFLHLFLIVSVFSILGRVPPVGTNEITYYGLSILPFVIFLYPSQQIMRSVLANTPLLYFSRVKLCDILIARGALEIVNGILVALLIIVVLTLISGEFNPANPFLFLVSIIVTLLFGFSLGAVSALIAQIFPFWLYASAIIYPLFWLLSGIIFFPNSIPNQYQFFIAFNPLLHCVESIRYSYFFDYPSNFIEIHYPFFFSIFLIATTFLLDRVWRRLFLNS